MTPQNLVSLPDRLSGLANQQPTTDDASQPSSDNSNLIDNFLRQASTIIQQPFTKLSDAYPDSSKEAQDVQNAIGMWINATVNTIKTSGPERPDNF
jgi:hypothetical protein